MNLELNLIRPLRYAVRALARSRAFTLTAILSVGGAIGLAASVYAVIAATFFAPLPWDDPDAIVQLWQTASPESTQLQDYLQPVRMEEWVRRGEFRTMSAVAASGEASPLVARRDDGAERVESAPILGDWFGLLGVDAARGRVLTPDDLRPGAAPAVVVSHAFWETDLSGGDLGTVFLSGVAYSVVGVMPPRFEAARQVWIPVEALPLGSRPVAYAGVGRLRPGMSAGDAAAEVQLLATNQVRADSARFAGLGATAASMSSAARSRNRPQLWMLAGVVAAVLLVALNNLAVLTMVRAESRSTDLAVRASLGADRWELGRGLALEGILIGLVGAGVGLVAANWGKDFAAGFIGGSTTPPVLGVDTIAVAFGLGALVAASLALIPMQRVSGLDLREWLQRGSGGVGSTPSERRTRQVLVACQVAVAVVLISVTTVVGTAWQALAALDVGYDGRQVVEARADWEMAGMAPSDQWALAERAVARIERSPGVVATAAWQQMGQDFPPRPEIAAVTDGPVVELGTFDGLYRYYEVTPGFFETLGLDLVEGRGFTSSDGEGGAPIAIVSNRGADLWWPGENPLGRQIKLGEGGVWMTVVGIAPDFQGLNMLGKLAGSRDSPTMPLLFMPAGQFASPPTGWRAYEYWGGVRVGALAEESVGAATRAVRQTMTSEAPDLTYISFGPLQDAQMEAGEGLAVTGRLIAAALLAVLGLSLVGIVGVVSESVSRRTREVGVRIALGADGFRVAWTVARESVFTALVGVVGGVAVLFLIDGWLQAAVFDYLVNRLAPGLLTVRVLGLAVATISVVALTAILLASRRALRINPIDALRAE